MYDSHDPTNKNNGAIPGGLMGQNPALVRYAASGTPHIL